MRLIIVGFICLGLLVAFAPIETSLIPQWTVQVADVNGTPCASMSVRQSWGDYSLYDGGNGDREDRFTDQNGYVRFPERRIRASVLRRITMPVVTRILNIMHGSGGVEGVVWATGIKDVVWLSYERGNPLPGKMRVEKCISETTGN